MPSERQRIWHAHADAHAEIAEATAGQSMTAIGSIFGSAVPRFSERRKNENLSSYFFGYSYCGGRNGRVGLIMGLIPVAFPNNVV
jgi:hypothetical protein